MAAISQRNGSWRAVFRFNGQQHAVTIGKVDKTEAGQWKAKIEHILMRLKQHLLELPAGVPITAFVLSDGKQSAPASPTSLTTFGQLRDAYLKVRSGGSIEANTLSTITLHLRHFENLLSKNFLLAGLNHANLQEYVTGRATDTVKALDQKKIPEGTKRKTRKISAATIRKEITTFRGCWNWGINAGHVKGEFPSAGLEYPKLHEKMPFATIAECHRRIRAGADPAQVYESLYLDPRQITKLLTWLKGKKCRPWFYPMIATTSYTGARRSELIRMKIEDVDFTANVITIREQKRAKGRHTTRRVPITPLLAEIIKPLMVKGRIYLFGDGKKPLTVNYAKLTFKRIFAKSPWKMVRGFHVFRHSFISVLASKGIDQRIIDDLVSHSTEAQRKRYRHLFPQVTQDAIAKAFS